MVKQTFGNETDVTRCVIGRGKKRISPFYRHQMSDHHEGYDFADVIADIRLEYLSPVEGAGGGLAQTAQSPPNGELDEGLKTAEERFALAIAEWWTGRK